MRFPDSMMAAASLPTASHPSSVFGAFSSVPFGPTTVPAESNTRWAAGPTMPFMICFTLATGVNASFAGASLGACLARRAPATMNTNPPRNRATLTTSNQWTVRTGVAPIRRSMLEVAGELIADQHEPSGHQDGICGERVREESWMPTPVADGDQHGRERQTLPDLDAHIEAHDVRHQTV